MSRDKAEIERLLCRLLPLGPVRARAMFGGHGLYLDDAMFAIVTDDDLWFKTDAASQTRFAAAGGRPFVYQRQGKAISLSFWSLPPAIRDDPAALCDWAELALTAARASAAERAKAKARRARSR
jgi:DNA transformation protein